MTPDDFWNLVDRVHTTSGGDMEKKCELLKKELKRLPVPEIRSFQNHFDDAMDAAYRWDLWGAAFVINGGCSDDGFTDFRATLISMGRTIYQNALTSPESLADLEVEEGEDLVFEGFQYVPTTALEEIAPEVETTRAKRHPAEPAGTPWDEDAVYKLFPKLAEKYG